MIGETYNRLTVLEHVGRNKQSHILALCRCSCGTVRIFNETMVRLGHSKSCGCLRREKAGHNFKRATHNQSKSHTYSVWLSMHSRCKNPKTVHWHRYGGRGITVCERWNMFENFLADMGECPPKLQIDRIDNDKGYFPGNCRWVTVVEQANNRSDCVLVEHNGKTQTLSMWARELGFKTATVTYRYRQGWRPPELFGPLVKGRPNK